MTDARLPERFLMDRRLQRLPDGAYRSYINALLYSVANRSDGCIDPEDLGLIPGFAANAAKTLISAGLWAPRVPAGWLIVDFAATQSSRDDLERLEKLRANDRRKKQAKRASPPDGPGDIPGDGPGGQAGGRVPATAQAGRQAGEEGQDKQAEPGELFTVDPRESRSTFIQNH